MNLMDNPYPKGIKGEKSLSELLKGIKKKEIKYFFGEVSKSKFSKFLYFSS